MLFEKKMLLKKNVIQFFINYSLFLKKIFQNSKILYQKKIINKINT